MNDLNTFIAFVLVFGTIVFFHELGHFVVAKLAGVQVYEFALGFGPAIFKAKPGETAYSIRLFPLGGFVKLAGMDESEEAEEPISPDDPRNFNNKAIPVRMATIAAGPLMNFFLAMVMFAIYFMLIVVPPTIALVEPGSAADQAGFRAGDELVAIDNQKVETTGQVISIIQDSPEQILSIQVRRGDSLITLDVAPTDVNGAGRLGVDIQDKPQLPLIPSIIEGIRLTGHVSRELVVSLVRMVTGQMQADLAGPVGIFQIVGEAANQGLANLLFLAALLNINLGLLNLLPVPVLDGGWLVLLGLEGVRGKPIAPEHRGIAQFIGLALLILLMVFATFQDLSRLIFS